MEPHIGDDETQMDTEVNSIVHTMKFLFTVYAIEDIDIGEGKKGKRQKLHFHDYRMQMLREKNTYYSTGKNLNLNGDYRTIGIKKKFTELAKNINGGMGLIKESNESTDGENHAHND